MLGFLKTSSKRLTAKAKPPKRPRKGIQRSRKPIARKAVIRVYDHPFKRFKLQPTENIRRKAEACRAEQLAAQNPAEIAFKELLDAVGLDYEYQKIIYRTGSFVCLDFLLKEAKVCVELDGKSHETTRGYDSGRDRWLLEAHGVKTVRIPAKTAFDSTKAMLIIMEAINV